jgi:hypothetical protein
MESQIQINENAYQCTNAMPDGLEQKFLTLLVILHKIVNNNFNVLCRQRAFVNYSMSRFEWFCIVLD